MYTEHQIRNFKRYLFKTDNTRPFIRAVKGDERLLFLSLHDCSEHFQICAKEMWEIFIHEIVYQGYHLSYIGYNDSEAIYAKLYLHIRRDADFVGVRSGICRPIKVLNIHTDEITTFASIKKAAAELGMRPGNVLSCISTPTKCHLLYEKYLVIDEHRNFDFITQEQRKTLLSRLTVPIIVYDTQTQTTKTFSSLSAYLRITKQLPSLQNYQRYLRKNGIIAVSRWHYIIRQTPTVSLLTKSELQNHFVHLIREM